MKRTRNIPKYQIPFSSTELIHELSRKYATANARYSVTESRCLESGRLLLEGVNERANLQIIFHWKLQAFMRFPWVRDWPSDLILSEEISHALIPARSISLSDKRTICHALRALTSLPYVGVPVASAVLMAMYPTDFTVIDRQAYKTLKVKFCDPIPPEEYLIYREFCQDQARRLDVSMRQYDQALWQAGRDAGRSRRPQ